MRFGLPPTADGPVPAFTDLPTCRDWIKRLPLLNPSQAQMLLLGQLRLLNGYTLAGEVRLALLEALQQTVRFVQGEGANLFCGKPLPLAPLEQKVLDTTHALWQAMLMGYLRCLTNVLGGSGELAEQAALICQRALALLADDDADLMRAGRQPDASLWRFAHALYSSAEALGVTQVPVTRCAASPAVQGGEG